MKITALLLSLCLSLQLPSGIFTAWSHPLRAESISSETMTETEADEEAPDIAAVMYAIADKECKDLIKYISEENMQQYTSQEEVCDLAMDYRDLLLDARVTASGLYYLEIPEADSTSLLRSAQQAYSMRMNAVEPKVIAASSIVRSLNRDNSYHFPWNTDRKGLYVLERILDGQLRMVVLLTVNEYHAVTVSVLPFLWDEMPDFVENIKSSYVTQLFYASDGDLLQEMKDAYKDGLIEESLLEALESGGEESMEALTKILEILGREVVLPELTGIPASEYQDADPNEILSSLHEYEGDTETPREHAERLAGSIAEIAEDNSMMRMSYPEEAAAVCEKCSIFRETPETVISIDLAELDPETLLALTGTDTGTIPEDILRTTLAYSLPSLLNGRLGSEYQIAQGALSLSAAVSGLDTDTCVYWLYYTDENGEPLVCSVSFNKNRNGCVDLFASPVFNTDFSDRLLEKAGEDAEASISFADFVEILTEEP